MDERADYIHRICELTHKLEVRANVCRGLYPVFKAADFLRISLDRLPLPDLLKEGTQYGSYRCALLDETVRFALLLQLTGLIVVTDRTQLRPSCLA